MKLLRLILLLLVARSACAGSVYNVFPPPGMTYNAVTGAITVGQVASPGNGAFTLCNFADGSVTANCILNVGIGEATSGQTYNNTVLNIGALSPGGVANRICINFYTGAVGSAASCAAGVPTFNSDTSFTYSAQGAMTFTVPAQSSGNQNELFLDANDDSFYEVNATSSSSGDGSFTARTTNNTSVGSMTIGIETGQNGASTGTGYGGITCTSNLGTLDTKGVGPGVPTGITGAPSVAGCVLNERGSGTFGTHPPFDFATENTSRGYYDNTGWHFQLPVTETTTTFASLGSCAAGNKGQAKLITDGVNTPTYAATTTGGGSTLIRAICDGSNWTNH